MPNLTLDQQRQVENLTRLRIWLELGRNPEGLTPQELGKRVENQGPASLDYHLKILVDSGLVTTVPGTNTYLAVEG